LEYDVKGMDDAGNVAENGEQNVDQQMDGTASLNKNAKRLKNNGNYDQCD
jgi:hypothetical protein